MGRVLIVGGLLALALTVYSIADCALTERDRIRALPRWAWIVLILALPVVGAALWLTIGRGAQPAPAARWTTGPDDDPAFLRSVRPAPATDEPDWRRLEQELVDLDADPDDDGDGRRR